MTIPSDMLNNIVGLATDVLIRPVAIASGDYPDVMFALQQVVTRVTVLAVSEGNEEAVLKKVMDGACHQVKQIRAMNAFQAAEPKGTA